MAGQAIKIKFKITLMASDKGWPGGGTSFV